MKVAIMGAGLSGLSCAITLEKHGIEPVVFEKRTNVGDRFINAEGLFSILNRPVRDCLKYIRESFDINLKPITEVEKVFLHSKHNSGTITGKIGYTNIRGRHTDSFEYQLARQLQSRIIYNSTMEYEKLCKEFDYIILATGDGEYACHLGNYKCDLTCTLKGATVEGNFTTNSPHLWFNYEILPQGYAWLIPYSEKEANFVIAYPDYPHNIKLDINDMWSKAYSLASIDLHQNFLITDRFEVTRYLMGICVKPKIDNTYFVGNCFGSISPGLGFGQFTSILTGVYSAYDICGIGDYTEYVKPLFENYNHSLVFRRFLETLTDNQLDTIIKSLNNVLISEWVDKVFDKNSSMDVLKFAAPLMRLWNNVVEP